MLLVAFAIFVFAVVIYAYAVRALDEPAGTRWLWFASVVAVSCALAMTSSHAISTLDKALAWLVTIGLVGWSAEARERAGGDSS
ncbi:hypothetical protein DSM104299_05157 [Baekduia alba]|uniref:hypothetical protein n=1 Tax=Baekduia alba TaxID=2997333 RepID=UPI0023405D90|nr:hypothetical protein [Baekduia alba]WCB96398.1 hypothetical protein DSM104299_05157 [Baekduia alba]